MNSPQENETGLRRLIPQSAQADFVFLRRMFAFVTESNPQVRSSAARRVCCHSGPNAPRGATTNLRIRFSKVNIRCLAKTPDFRDDTTDGSQLFHRTTHLARLVGPNSTRITLRRELGRSLAAGNGAKRRKFRARGGRRRPRGAKLAARVLARRLPPVDGPRHRCHFTDRRVAATDGRSFRRARCPACGDRKRRRHPHRKRRVALSPSKKRREFHRIAALRRKHRRA